MNNYDKIRKMTLKEMADWLDKISNEDRDDWDPIGCSGCCYYNTHHMPKECGKCEFEGGMEKYLKRKTKMN